MENEVEFLPEAREEFDEVVNWYATRSKAASVAFIAEVDAAIEKIIANPRRFPPTYADCQRCLLARFPFSVVYLQDDDRLVVIANAHERREPRYWTDRI